MKSLKQIFSLCGIFLISSVSAQIDTTANQKSKQRTILVSASLQHISDIDFVKREYKMELWLKFEAPKEDRCALTDLDKQISIKEAKEIKIDTIPNWHESLEKCHSERKFNPDTITKTLRIRCTMIQNWDVSDYPFDKQNLNITIYNPQRPIKWLKLKSKNKLIHFFYPQMVDNSTNLIQNENTWIINLDSARVVPFHTQLADPFNDSLGNWVRKKVNQNKTR